MNRSQLSCSSVIFIMLGILAFNVCTAQNGAPYWSTSGNSNATTTSKLGTTNSIPLRLLTKNLERIRIDTFGRVGIGTSTPLQQLHVAGHETVSGNLGLGITVPTQRLHVVGNGVFTGNVGIGTITPSQPLQVVGNGVFSGNVGIGTTSPSQKLYVSGNGVFTGNLGLGVTSPTQRLQVSGNATFTGNVGIGVTSPTYPLYVEGGSSLAIYGHSSSYIAIDGAGYYGVVGSGTYGVYGSGSYGVYGSGSSYGLYATGSVYGAYASGSTYGIWATGTNTAVVGQTTDGEGGNFYSGTGYGLVAGTGNSAKNWAGVFNGNVYAYGAYQTSDRKMKKNIEDVSDAMTIINQLKPRTYEFLSDGKMAALHLPTGKHYGLIAQELEEVLPDMVKEITQSFAPPIRKDASAAMPQGSMPQQMSASATQPATDQTTEKEQLTIKTINYTELIPILIKGLQEQQQQINELKDMIAKLSHGQTINSTLSNSTLEQNYPNPVSGSTKIEYTIPGGISNAFLVVTDNLGKTIKTIQLATSGSVYLDASTLSSGVYNYTLIIDNKAVQTKKLTVVK